GSLLRYFENQVLKNPSFFYAVQLDKEELITNIFWADTRMRIDYELFGDVLTFDTTFATNKEYRPLGVFVGFNHHREIVIFGATLLYDKIIDSFAWLFDKFLEVHGILCSHALKVLDVMNVKIIPDMYITKRWTRHAREGSMQTTKSYVNLEKAECGPIDRYREFCSEAVKLSSFASEFLEGYVIMKKVMGEAHKLMESDKPSPEP
ncbi:hypothetical protein CFOL_v3_34750, partial [Cephalotus follicularis]